MGAGGTHDPPDPRTPGAAKSYPQPIDSGQYTETALNGGSFSIIPG